MEENKLTPAEKLQQYIDSVGEEAFAQQLFEFDCQFNGINPNSKNARRKLRLRNFSNKIIRNLPTITAGFDLFALCIWMFILGVFVKDGEIGWIAASACFVVFFLAKVWKVIFNKTI